MDEEILTAPLVGLCKQAFHLMSEAQRREKVLEIQTQRSSYQTWRAAVEAEAKEKRSKTAPKKADISQFDEMF
jgi:hypothetical protein